MNVTPLAADDPALMLGLISKDFAYNLRVTNSNF